MATQHFNLISYARVSTNGQDSQRQQDALETAGCGRIFEDEISSRATTRPGLVEALDHLRSTDTLCIWKLGRLGRSVKEALTIADGLHEQGIDLRILTGALTGTYRPT